MKAKYYVNKYKAKIEQLYNEKNTETLAIVLNELLYEFVLEIKVIMTFRDSNSNKVLIGVLNELDNKWVSIASKINVLNKNGFRNYLKMVNPNITELMKWEKRTKR